MTCPRCHDFGAWTHCYECGWDQDDEPEAKDAPRSDPLTVVLPWDALASDNLRKGLHRESWATYKAARERAHLEASRYVPIGRPWFGERPVRITVRFWLPDRRRRDPNNLTKLICDALSGVAYKDDAQVRALAWTNEGVDPLAARAEVEIAPMDMEAAA